jgi:thymidylate synthase
VAEGYLEEYLPYLMTSAKQTGEDYTYGQFLEKQIEEVIRMYKEDGHETNQAYMTVGDQKSILLKDPPCLRGIDTRIKDGKLHFVVYFRSWDLWNGFPANLGAIQLLKEYMASSIGVEDGEIIAASKGLHLYDYVWELAKLRTMCENPSALSKGKCEG